MEVFSNQEIVTADQGGTTDEDGTNPGQGEDRKSVGILSGMTDTLAELHVREKAR